MSFSHRRRSRVELGINPGRDYYLIILSNHPNLLNNTYPYQHRPNQFMETQRVNGMLIPNVPVHFGAVQSEEHERLLYNTLRFQLHQIIRTYLQQTRRVHPIYLAFDLSNIEQQP